MGLKKIQNLFKDKKVKEQARPALSLATAEQERPKTTGQSQSVNEKAEIEAYIKSINSKLKDPQMAKKAAQILESWTKKN
ncbi:hypothetical protein [Halobacteriovorax sp. JY17]|uniref:hypothetical protein n=1 Tax=Halobacteriovorax sp. JY17 TaxID=2014617 RepID=UPI000C63538E|nr:hypothetical protein [Halobacteriovorax sp. JY17]PIK14747.1 MAG: hypothetical protein CES88_10435 [Halobacteriovorax sp. JY17]